MFLFKAWLKGMAFIMFVFSVPTVFLGPFVLARETGNNWWLLIYLVIVSLGYGIIISLPTEE
jgi:hypothetical protein